MIVYYGFISDNLVIGFKCSIPNIDNITTALQNCETPITALFFQNAKLSEIQSSILHQLPNVSFIDISDVKLISVENVTFCALSRLEDIDASKNILTELPSYMFAECYNLLELTLSENNLTKLRGDVFKKLTSLKKLDLSSNKIEVLIGDVFEPLVNLETLRLNNNRIRIIDDDLFAHNHNLQVLFLSYNLLETIQHGSFWKLKRLQTLDIGNNNELKSIDLTQMDRLQTVEVDQASLTMIYIPTNISQINASGNKITRIQADANSKLNILRLSGNRIHNLTDLSQLDQLNYLDLSDNGLTDIDFSCFSRIKNLTQLIINGNPFKQLNSTALLLYLPALQLLELSTDLIDADIKVELLEHVKKSNRQISISYQTDNNTTSNIQNTPTMSITSTSQPSTVDPEQKDHLIKTLLDRIEKLETIIKSKMSGTTTSDTNDMHNEMEKSVANLRLMIVWTILAFSLFVSIQIGVFVKRNYNRFHIPGPFSPRSVLVRGQSREPILEEVL